MSCSPFLLGEVINQDLNTWESQHPELIKEICDGLYVDDLMTGGGTVQLTAGKKVTTTKIFRCLIHHSQMTLKRTRIGSRQRLAVGRVNAHQTATWRGKTVGGKLPRPSVG